MERLYKLVDYYEKAPYESPDVIGYYGSYQEAIKAEKDYVRATDGECKVELQYCL